MFRWLLSAVLASALLLGGMTPSFGSTSDGATAAAGKFVSKKGKGKKGKKGKKHHRKGKKSNNVSII